MFQRIANWIDSHFVAGIYLTLATIVLLLIGILYAATPAKAAEATLNWEMPTQREDGSALLPSELASTAIKYGICESGQVPSSGATITVPAPAATVTIPSLTPGNWCFAASAVDVFGLQSAFTLPVSKTVNPTSPPKPPVFVTVDLRVYETRIHPTKGLVAGREVGTIALGEKCFTDANGDPMAGDDLYRVRFSDVTLLKAPKSELLVAKCAAS